MSMDLTLWVRVVADAGAHAAWRETSAQYTASSNRQPGVGAVGWEMPRLHGVELHHQTYTAERCATALPAQPVCSARVKATEDCLLPGAYSSGAEGFVPQVAPRRHSL